MTTPTQARTANEQRIASLEAEVVTMREVLTNARPFVKLAVEDLAAVVPYRIRILGELDAALSPSDYSTKVVVERKVIHEITVKLEKIRVKCFNDTISAADQHVHALATNCLARLDSLRQGGGG